MYCDGVITVQREIGGGMMSIFGVYTCRVYIGLLSVTTRNVLISFWWLELSAVISCSSHSILSLFPSLPLSLSSFFRVCGCGWG